MKCITSPELDDTKLVSYVEGEADEATVAHIKQCPYCAERAKQVNLLQQKMRARLYRSTCPSSMELGNYQLGLLPDPQKMVIVQHIRQCPHCRIEVAELEAFLAEPDVMRTITNVLFARLVDRGATPAFGALRGESKGPLTFEADGVVITLDVQPGSNSHVSILGQLAADDQDEWTGATVELQQADAPQLIASVDDLGAFRFETVRPGSIKFSITSPGGVVIQSPDIEITA